MKFPIVAEYIYPTMSGIPFHVRFTSENSGEVISFGSRWGVGHKADDWVTVFNSEVWKIISSASDSPLTFSDAMKLSKIDEKLLKSWLYDNKPEVVQEFFQELDDAEEAVFLNSLIEAVGISGKTFEDELPQSKLIPLIKELRNQREICLIEARDYIESKFKFEGVV